MEDINTTQNKVSELISKLCNRFELPLELVILAKRKYANDQRSYQEIEKEILDISRKVELMEQIVNTPIDSNILDNSILIIGPMGVGKSTISDELSKSTGLKVVSLDNGEQLSHLYQQKPNYRNFKDFEFYLTSSVLTELDEPMVIDFGAGHSIYENPIMFYEMKKLITKFKNVILILPSEDLNESLRIINERISTRDVNDLNQRMANNKHFIESPCNYELSTDIIYTNNMSLDEITNTILQRIESRKIEQKKH